MPEPLYILKTEYRNQINKIMIKNGLAISEFSLTQLNASFIFTYADSPLYFQFTLENNSHDFFSTRHTKFNPSFNLYEYKQLNGKTIIVRIGDALNRFDKWLANHVCGYKKEVEVSTQESQKQLFSSLEKSSVKTVNDPTLSVTTRINELELENDRLNNDLLTQNDTLSKTNTLLDNSKRKILELESKIHNPKYLIYIKWAVFFLLSYIVFTSSMVFEIDFNPGVYLAIQVLMVLLLTYTLIKKSSEKSTFWLNFIAGVFLVVLGVVLTKII